MRESTLRELTLRLKNAAPTLQLEENADMARYTTLHLGGPADLTFFTSTGTAFYFLFRGCRMP